MSAETKGAVSHVMVAGCVCLESKVLGGGEANSPAQVVTVLVEMPLELKRKAHAEAKRRQQSFSEFVCSRCDLPEEVDDI